MHLSLSFLVMSCLVLSHWCCGLMHPLLYCLVASGLVGVVLMYHLVVSCLVLFFFPCQSCPAGLNGVVSCIIYFFLSRFVFSC